MKLIICGMLIGIANIIPGVSGGTMAVILKIYDKLIFSISNLYKKESLKESIKYLMLIGIGAVSGILLFSKFIEYTLNNFPTSTNIFFAGLIAGSIPMILNKTKITKKISISSIICLIISLTLVILMKFLSPEESTQIITTLNLASFLKLFIASIFSAGAMIIPGLSGSFLMLIFGIYQTILSAVSNINILILMPVGLGCLVGILGCAKIIEKLFLKYSSQTYCAILGFMIGSIFIIFPSLKFDLTIIINLILFLGASIMSYSFSKK